MGEIEHQNCIVKERVQGIFNPLLSNKIPGRLVVEMVYTAVFLLNTFHPAGYTLSNLSPQTIVTGLSVYFNKYCKHEFGTYLQTHVDTENNMRARTVGALALRPTGNDQGRYYYLSLETRQCLNRLHATELPMYESVIKEIHQLAQQYPSGLKFLNQNVQQMLKDKANKDDDSNNLTYVDDENSSSKEKSDGGNDNNSNVDEPIDDNGSHKPDQPCQITGVNNEQRTIKYQKITELQEACNQNINKKSNASNLSSRSQRTWRWHCQQQKPPNDITTTTQQIPLSDISDDNKHDSTRASDYESPNTNQQIKQMARHLSSAYSSRLAQDDMTNTSKIIRAHDEDNDGFPPQIRDLEKELKQIHKKFSQQLNNQQHLRRGLHPRRTRNTIPRKFRGMPAANDSDIYIATHLKDYTYMYLVINKIGIPDSENPMTSDLATTVLT